MSQWWLTEARIEGFRRLQAPLSVRLTDSLERPLDTLVVAGSNGAGKTSLLEAILFGLGREHLLGWGAAEEVVAQTGRRVLPAHASIRLTLTRRDQPEERLVYARQPGRLRIRREVGEQAREELDLRDLASLPLLLAEIPDSMKVEETRYFSSWRTPALVGPISPSVGWSIPSSEANRLWAFKQRVINLRARDAFRGKSSAADALLDRLNAAWRVFHEDDGTYIDADVHDPADEEKVLFDLYIHDGDGARRCSVDEASAGELELLSFASSLLMGESSGLVIIDEPELHLHPEWISQIKRALRALSPAAQFIISTHASQPWDQASAFERLLLGAPGDPRLTALPSGEG